MTYTYVCKDCQTNFDIKQRLGEPALENCKECGGRLRKVLHIPAIRFNGTGFYTTDSKVK
jgi:putative FmdB family regulatory protein